MTAALDYRATHWGEEGPVDGRRIAVAVPTSAPLETICEVRSIVYRTKKRGDARPTPYEHAFERPFPKLARVRGARGASLVIVGGGYTVTRRGIEETKRARATRLPDPTTADLVDLGELEEFGLADDKVIAFRRPRPRLAYSAGSRGLFIAGGNHQLGGAK